MERAKQKGLNKRPANFPQSRAILGQNAHLGLSASQAALPVLIKRGRGGRVVTIDGCVLHDFWLAEGRYPCGHAPCFLTQAQKNAVSLGNLKNYPQNEHIRLLNRIARLLPGYRLCFARPDPHIPEGAECLDLRRTAFCESAELLPAGPRPDIVLINGALFLDVLAIRDGCPTPPDCAALEYPDAASAVRASLLLRRLHSPDEPYTKIESLAALFKERAGSMLVGEGDACGDSALGDAALRKGSALTRVAPSARLRVAMNEEKRNALLREGFLLSSSGAIFFCSAHDPRTVVRLAKILQTL